MQDPVLDAYATRAAEYAAALGRIEATQAEDRATISGWARGVVGSVIDVGCGPGHWTNYLHSERIAISGIDPVPEFLALAAQHYPGVPFEIGEASQLREADASVGGLLAWYSLIHLDPDAVGPVLSEFSRVLAPGGALLLGFFAGAELKTFEHAIAPAWFWPIKELARRVEQAGFDLVHVAQREGDSSRPHGQLSALKR